MFHLTYITISLQDVLLLPSSFLETLLFLSFIFTELSLPQRAGQVIK